MLPLVKLFNIDVSDETNTYLLLVHVPLINEMIKGVFVFTQIIFDIKVCLIWNSVTAHAHTLRVKCDDFKCV